jgi:hypothetical protein
MDITPTGSVLTRSATINIGRTIAINVPSRSNSIFGMAHFRAGDELQKGV